MFRSRVIRRLISVLAVLLVFRDGESAGVGIVSVEDQDTFHKQSVSYGDTTREEILQTRERRKKQLRAMILDSRRKLADMTYWEQGSSIDNDKKKVELETSIDLFQRKLDSMQVDLEEWEIERLIVRGKEHADRRRERSQGSRKIQSEF